MPASAHFGPDRMRSIFLQGASGKKPAIPIDPAALEQAAEMALSANAFNYIGGAAGTETTARHNLEAFSRYRLHPRMLHNVAERSLGITLFGKNHPLPFLLAPVGVLDLAHPNGELAVARAAAACGVTMIFSNQASHPMEACAAEMGTARRWFQLYWSQSNDLVASLVRRAEACGCEAVVVTLDTTLLGWRPRDLAAGYLPFLEGRGIAQYTSDSVFQDMLRTFAPPAGPKPRITLKSLHTLWQMLRRYPGGIREGIKEGKARRAVQLFTQTYSRPSLTWQDLSFLRNLTSLPILLKGILHPEDARLALDHGLDGIIVSNHGGRQVDHSIAALDALPAVVDAVQGRLPVLFDSGIRTGADAAIALALGAKAVCIGRPYAYGLALGGQAGVQEVIENFTASLDLTLGLMGCADVNQLNRSWLVEK